MVSAVLICGLGYWMNLLNSGAADEFHQTYKSWSMSVPQITNMITGNLKYWKIILGLVTAVSFICIFWGGKKLHYISLILPIITAAFLFIVYYYPVVQHGSII